MEPPRSFDAAVPPGLRDLEEQWRSGRILRRAGEPLRSAISLSNRRIPAPSFVRTSQLPRT